jgi:hypothetical protein
MELTDPSGCVPLGLVEGDILEVDVAAPAEQTGLCEAPTVHLPMVRHPVSVHIAIRRRETLLDMTEALSVAELAQQLGLLPSAKVSETVCRG